MEGLELLAQARTAGLVVEAHGTELVVKGPKRAAAIALKLIEHKAAVLAALDTSTAKGDGTTERKPHGLTIPHKPVPCFVEKIAGKPYATITCRGKTYELQQIVGMWFFRLTLDAGWTCCSPEFVAIIENTEALTRRREQDDHVSVIPGTNPGGRSGI